MRQHIKRTNIVSPPVPRGPNGRWLKGVGGNPLGINMNQGILSSAELVRQAREQGPKCIEFLIMVRDSTDYLIRDRFNAAVELLNRGFGRPTQPIAGGGDAANLPLKVLVEFIEENTIDLDDDND